MLHHFLLLRILLWVPQTKYDTLFWLACFFVCFYGSTNGWLYHLITAQVWFWKYEYFVDINIYTWYWFYIIDKYMEALYLFNMYMYIYIYIYIWKLCELGMTSFFYFFFFFPYVCPFKEWNRFLCCFSFLLVYGLFMPETKLHEYFVVCIMVIWVE